MSKVIDDLRITAESRGYDIDKVAEKTGVTARTISSILTGKTDNPHLDTLELIAEYFGGEITFNGEMQKYTEASGDVSFYRRLIVEKQDQINIKDRWIRVLFWVCICLIIACVILALHVKL